MIYQLVIDDFQKMRDVHADGLYVISALANILDTQFSEYVQDSFQYIKHGLQKTNEPDLFKTSLGTLSDICRSCSQAIEPLIEEVIPQLLQLISTQNIDKQIKLHIFNCLGDIALNCQKTVNKYLDQIIQIYNLGFSAAISLQSNADQDSQDYSEQLKDHLIESYVCFLHAMQDVPESKTKILSHVQTVVQFIEKSCAPNLNPTVVHF